MPPRLPRLRLERLEQRSLPTVLPPPPLLPQTDPFDRATLGSLPAGWRAWHSTADAANALRTAVPAAGVTPISDPHVLASTVATSAVTSRAWDTAHSLADVTATVHVRLDSSAPAAVIVKGNSLDTTVPSYYALTVRRFAGGVSLTRVHKGAAADVPVGALTLAEVSSLTPTAWVRVTLFAHTYGPGSVNLRGEIFAPATGKYLNPDNVWQATPTWAFNVVDDSPVALFGPGHSGVARAAGSAGALTFDEFNTYAVAADKVRPTVTITAPGATGPLSGLTPVAAMVADNRAVTRVEFYVDGVLRARTGPATAVWMFNTASVPDGAHTLMVRAYDADENFGEARRVVTTANDTTVSVPSYPRHYGHIRVGLLGWEGWPHDAVSDQLLRNSVDLVMPGASSSAYVDGLAPNTPQMHYANVSNIYQELLPDWLAFADSRELNREGAFYHVTRATPFYGDSPSSRPVKWMWHAARSGPAGWTDLTTAARSEFVDDVAWPAAGESLVFGSPDRFRELNVTLSTTGVGGGYRVQYATAVDAAGQVSAWADLPLTADGTAGLTQSGTVEWTPPADWTPGTVGGSERVFFVRFLTTAAFTRAPAATTVFGRDYVNATTVTVGGRTYPAGTIPAFDAAADGNRDGYLDDAEYLFRANGMDARFYSESRVFAGTAFQGSYGQMRFATNPADAGFAGWAVDYWKRQLDARPLMDGLMMDNSQGRTFLAGVPDGVVESVSNFGADYAALVVGVARGIAARPAGRTGPPRWVIPNTNPNGRGADHARLLIEKLHTSYEEFQARPLSDNAGAFLDVADTVWRRSQYVPAPALLMVDTSLPAAPSGQPENYWRLDPRAQMAALTYYYLIASDATMLTFFGGDKPASSWAEHWSPAAAYDVGQPAEPAPRRTNNVDPPPYQTGPIPGTGLTYRVFSRQYRNGDVLVLYKPLPTGSGSIRLDETQATAVALPLPPAGTEWRVLGADGVLGGTAVTAVTLRNGEGAIAVRVASTGPDRKADGGVGWLWLPPAARPDEPPRAERGSPAPALRLPSAEVVVRPARVEARAPEPRDAPAPAEPADWPALDETA